MFDINIFKNEFREWLEANPLATEFEVRKLCAELCTNFEQKKYSWLINESINWHQWKKTIFEKELRQCSENKYIIIENYN